MMLIKESLIDPLNDQIRSEFTASAQYIAIAVYFAQESLVELANFFYRQAEEEREHAMKFVYFMLEAGARPIVPGLPELRNDYSSPADAVEFARDQEIKVTRQINDLVTQAVAEGDHITNNFLQWFVDEQLEEVDTMSSLLQTIRHAGGSLLLVEDFVRRNLQHGDDEGTS